MTQKQPGIKGRCKRTPLKVDKPVSPKRYVCGICNSEVTFEPKLFKGSLTWRVSCNRCGTLMASYGNCQDLIDKAVSRSYILLEDTNGKASLSTISKTVQECQPKNS